MNFRTKILLLPITVGIAFGLGLALSFTLNERNAVHLETLRTVDNPFLEQVLLVERGVEQLRTSLQAAASEGDPDKLDEAQVSVKAVHEALTTARQLNGKSDTVAGLAKAFEAYQTAALAATSAMLKKTQAGGDMQRMQDTQTQFAQQLQEIQKEARAVLDDRFSSVAAGQRQGQWISGITAAVILLGLGLGSRLILASVWKDLGGEPSELRALVHRVAEGDLDIAVTMAAHDRTSLGAAVASMTERLRNIVGSIRQTSDSIANASTEIALGNQDLSNRTEQTANNLQQVSSELGQLSGTVAHSAESSQQAKQLATTVAGAAQRGGGIVQQVVHNMEEINTASLKINEIIGVIDGIAFQTNILALNAAVEAARAGEQGRGFAVVASEVRSLAQRSAQAAKEIKTLIHASSEKIQSGTRLVNDAGQAMGEIVAGVQRVVGIIGEISDASAEQSSGIHEVSGTITQLDQMTQQNAALVEQSAAAAESLRDQTEQLVQAVAVFKLTATGHPLQTPHRIPAATAPKRLA
ncbi:MAG: chemotaxis protein [Ferruginibacter sp.]|nr:chemotaxis protein [Rhodoferax sp.]